eukprot:395443_1
MTFLITCLFLIVQRININAECLSSPSTTCYSKELIYDFNSFTSSSTIQITNSIQNNYLYQLYFEINEYQCMNPKLTIFHQQINSFMVQYHQNYIIKTIQCNTDTECLYTSCITNYLLSNQTIEPNTVYPIIINVSSSYTECETLNLNVNLTLSCSNVNPELSDWSDKTTNRFKLWYKEITEYITYRDRWIYFSICGGILLCICSSCCIACVRQCRQQKNVKPHPKPKYAKKKKKKKKFNEYKEVKENEDDHSALKSKKGVIYLQTRYYDEKQLQNIKTAWGNNYNKAPKILFGDNYADKHRPMHIKYRSKSAGQSKVIGKYDRQYGFGIATTFDNAKQYGFTFSDKNFKIMIQNEFKKLKKHLLCSGDVIIPYPTNKDLKEKPQKYFKDGNYTSNQLIFHNLGTG